VDTAKAFLPRQEESCGWISLHGLYLLMSFSISELSINKGAWRDILSAVALYQPRIKAKLRLESIKKKIFEKFESFFVEHSSVLAEKSNSDLMECTDWCEEARPLTTRCLSPGLRVSSDQRVPGSGSCSPQPPSTLHSPSLPSLGSPELVWPQGSPLTLARFTQLHREILAQAGSLGNDDLSLAIGDWRLDVVEENQLRLSVKSGYGASRKNSFLQPDFAAILRYSLVLGPDSVSLTINERSVHTGVISKILEKTEVEGSLSFLVQLISLRPCFGLFSPELVETVSQSLARDSVPDKLRNVFIDNKFIGTSSCGRTYAGTVRHQECHVLALDRVSDMCTKCQELSTLTINRSVLAQEQTGENVKDRGQKSVWQLATTSSDSCSFVCPQIQSFNTSLPHAFDGRAQASSIVSHRVEIANNLNVQVKLGEKIISKTFAEFQRSRQLGPLLDWVAGLRLCVGYPNSQLVEQAKYILDNQDRIGQDNKKLFKHLTVDEKFEFKMTSDEKSLTGSIRSVNCSGVAEASADICSNCRTLQEPMEFLSP